MSTMKEKRAWKKYEKAYNRIMNRPHHDSHKKKKKYRHVIGEDEPDYDLCDVPDSESLDYRLGQVLQADDIPPQMILRTDTDPGIFCGHRSKFGLHKYIGLRQGTEGNLLITGGNGSGKSAGIIKPMLFTWQAAMCVTDIKGELSSYYQILYEHGYVNRPYIIFDPMQIDGTGYDPFYWVKQDEEYNIISNIQEIAFAIIPTSSTDQDRFWTESEQSVLAAALLYFYNLGCDFESAITKILTSTVSKLSEEITEADDTQAKMLLGQTFDLKPEQLASIDRGIRNKLSAFATDPYISNAFRSIQDGTDCFTWDDLDKCNIFLCIPAHKIEQWGSIINLMYTQLIHHLERRPDQYSPEGANNIQTLLLMDEFARFGKLDMITHALATLRSKNVNICLVLQSLAQLDKIYGEYDRRIILDNCQFQAVLRANDADTQEYISRLIGTHVKIQHGKSENYDDDMEFAGYSSQMTETREPVIFPHELATLTDILLISPYGFCRVDKFQLSNQLDENPLFPEYIEVPATAVSEVTSDIQQDDSSTKSLPGTADINHYDNSGITIISVRTLPHIKQ